MAASPSRSTTFRLRNYDCIGFDMDHTLCRYRLPAFFEMQYGILAEFLVERMGYDPRLKRPIGSDMEFLQKGLVLDVERGNFLKVSASGRVLRASHGTRQLSGEEVTRQYGPTRTNDWLRRLAANPLIDSTERHFHRKFRPFKDYFDLPAAILSARIVDLLDYHNNNKPLEKYSFWRDVLLGLVDMFSRENLKRNLGGYYPEMKARAEKYLRPCEDKLKSWLKELKRRQVTFLISGSDPEYVDQVASFCLGSDWQSYFDFVVCASKKPGFFLPDDENPPRQFHRHNMRANDDASDPDVKPDELLAADTPTIYTQGNWAQLKDSMAEYCGLDKPKCLYFGDHLIQDVLAADLSHLDAIAVVEEVTSGELDSTRWGSFFRDDDDDGGVTWLGSLIRNHSRLCVHDVECVAKHPVERAIIIPSSSNGDNDEDGPAGRHHHQQQEEPAITKFLGFLPSPPVI